MSSKSLMTGSMNSGREFQTATLLRWRPSEMVDLLRLDPEGTGRPAIEMSAMAVGIGDDRVGALRDAVLGRLMS